MPHRITHTLDTVIVTVLSVVTAATPIVTSPGVVSETEAELRMLLLPLLGALIVSGGMIMLNPQPETRRIVIGRGIFALFFGAVSPSLIAMLHPSLSGVIFRPVFLLCAGGVIAGVVYALSKPFTRQLYDRAEHIAQKEAERLEQRMSPPVEERTVTIVEKHPIQPHDQ